MNEVIGPSFEESVARLRGRALGIALVVVRLSSVP